MGRRLVTWFLLGVAVGLVPVLLNLALAAITLEPVTAAVLFGRGELLMVSVGLAAGAVGELLDTSRDPAGLRSAAIAVCFLISIAATGVYAFVLAARTFDVSLSAGAIAGVSLVPYIMSVLISGISTAVVRRRGR